MRVDDSVQGRRAGRDPCGELAQGADGGDEREEGGAEPRDWFCVYLAPTGTWIRAPMRERGQRTQEHDAEYGRSDAQSEEEELRGAQGGGSAGGMVRAGTGDGAACRTRAGGVVERPRD